MRGGAVVARWAHNPKVIGSSPVPATKLRSAFKYVGFFNLSMYTVYILYSVTHKKHYTGYTSNFRARLISHNELGNKDWATKYRPWKVILTEEYSTKADAIKREKWMKSGIGRAHIKSIPH